MASSPSPRPGARHVVVFDFDLTLIDVNSDTHVPEVLAPDVLAFIREEARSTPWTALMAEACARMHARGVARAQVEACLRAMPAAPELLAAVRIAAAAGAQLHVVSDANAVFISEFLEAHQLAPLFASVSTNRAAWRADGLLEVSPFHDAAALPHGCARCPPNLCKGRVLGALGLSAAARSAGNGGDAAAAAAAGEAPAIFVTYLGDGGGDLCPSLRLGAGDLVLAREAYPLARALRAAADAGEVAAAVAEWRDGRALAAALLERLGLAAPQHTAGAEAARGAVA